MARPLWKFNYLHGNVIKYIFLKKFKKKKKKPLYNSSSIVTKTFYKDVLQIYKGNSFVRVAVTKYTVGYKLGEFTLTRKPFSFPRKKKR